ncbi:MAG TPA: hypothetical protein PKX93_02950, partial [bacterium]|nr:hypothetical protein [bacterium]
MIAVHRLQVIPGAVALQAAEARQHHQARALLHVALDVRIQLLAQPARHQVDLVLAVSQALRHAVAIE